jgi:hypothetical protein
MRQTVFKAVCRVFIYALFYPGMALKTERRSHARELQHILFHSQSAGGGRFTLPLAAALL